MFRFSLPDHIDSKRKEEREGGRLRLWHAAKAKAKHKGVGRFGGGGGEEKTRELCGGEEEVIHYTTGGKKGNL